MKISRRTALALLLAPTILPARALGQKRLHVDDFGADPTGTLDCGDAFARAIKECDKFNSKLSFGQGTYRIDQRSGRSISLNDLRAVEIEGNGARILFDGDATGISVHGVQDISIADLTLDWVNPAFTQGKIVDRDRSGSDVTVALDPKCRLADCRSIYSVQYYQADGSGRVIITDRNQAVARWKVLDREHIQIVHDSPVDQSPGAIAVAFHTRNNFGIILGESSNPEFDRVTLRTAPGMGFVGTAVTNLTMRHCTVAPDPLSGHVISTTADAVHFWGCRGTFEISDSTFVGMGDDGINIHSFFLGASPSGNTSLELDQQNEINRRSVRLHPILYPRVGDQLAVYDSSSFAPLCDVRVTAASDRSVSFEPKTSLPPRMLVVNIGQMPTVAVRRSKFASGAASGVLLKGNIVVEECDFTNLGWTGITGQVDQLWMEGPPIQQAAIRRSVFDRCGHNFRGSLSCSAQVKGPSNNSVVASTPVLGNLEIQGCTFRGSLGLPISVRSALKVQVQGNAFRSLPENTGKGLLSSTAMQILGCGNVTVKNNTSDCRRDLDVQASTATIQSNRNLHSRNDSKNKADETAPSCIL